MKALRFSLPTVVELLSLPVDFRKKTTSSGFLKKKLPAEYWTQSSAEEIPIELWNTYLPSAEKNTIQNLINNNDFKIYICDTGFPGAQRSFGESGLCPMLPITKETANKLEKQEILRIKDKTGQIITLSNISEDDRWLLWSFISKKESNFDLWAKYEFDVFSFDAVNYMRTEKFAKKIINIKLYSILKDDKYATKIDGTLE
ncbi:MAG: hypothetical protein PHX62_05580 [Bacilli bacterium]|nr:hypothetical protein [Bacilli bacterium]